MITNGGDTCINLSDKKIKWSNLNLLEQVIPLCRRSIINDCSKKKIDLADYKEVAEYIRRSLEENIRADMFMENIEKKYGKDADTIRTEQLADKMEKKGFKSLAEMIRNSK